jgi:hypothetical protein
LELEGVLGGRRSEVSWGFGPPDNPPFALKQEAYLGTIGKFSAPQKEISQTNVVVSVGVEVERGLVGREINCVSNDASDRSL